jgi:peptidyl-prolyl cis-trans isomerase C
MTSYIAPGRLPALLKLIVLMLMGLAFGALPMASTAQDASSSSSAEPAPTPEPPGPNTVVATVGGETITEADLAFAAEDIGQQLSKIPQDQIRAVLLAQVIDLRLMAQAGKAAGLENSDTYKMRLQYLTERALRRAYTNQVVSDQVTPEKIQERYNEIVAGMPTEDEVHARHILVSTEDDAKAIKAQLDAGADFATLAKEKSIEPGAKDSGGDLGYFKAAQMVKPFADAAFAMKVGEISNPVQTQFGWHIIKVEDRRPAAKPTLEQLSQQIGQQIYIETYQAKFDELLKATTLDIPDAALKAQVEAQLTPQK